MFCLGGVYAYRQQYLFSAMAGAICTGIILYLLYSLVPGGMGYGDVKLMPALAMWLDFPECLLALWLAFGLGSLYGLGIMLWRGKDLKYQLPFGPFLCLGMLLALLHGKGILALYYELCWEVL